MVCEECSLVPLESAGTSEFVIVFRDGEPCNHVGCMNHVSHPCEGCGRKNAAGNVILPKRIVDSWSVK